MTQCKKTATPLWVQPTLISLSLAVAASAAQAAPGDLDTSFAGTGWVTTSVGGLKDATNVGNDTVVQADGKILVVGQDYNGTNDDITLCRLNANGSLDTTFDGDGRIFLTVGNGNEVGYSVILQADGKIVVAGSASVFHGATADTDVLVARYNSDGSLDTGFGTGGVVTTNVSGDDIARDIIQQADGKLVITGDSLFANKDIIAVRYNTDGSLDTTFDTDGKANISVLSGEDIGYSLVQQADGKLAITGTAHNGNDTDTAVIRLNANGSLDTSFDTDGKLTRAIGTALITPTDNVTVSVATPAVITWAANGLAVNTPVSFTTTGTLPTGLSTGTTYYVKTIITGNTFTVSSTPGGAAIATTVAGTGTHTATASVTVGADDHGYSILQQTDGALVIAGDASTTALKDFVILRYLANGTADTTFDGDGAAITNVGTNHDVAYSIVQQADGKLVATGYSKATNEDFALVRYNADGSLDTSFSTDGKLTTAVNTGADFAYSVALQTDGKLVAAGKTIVVSTNSLDDIGVARYNTDGSADTTFNTTGKINISGGSTESRGYAVTQQTDGKLVVAGHAYAAVGTGIDFSISRYNADGSLDTGFGGDGMETTAFGAAISEYANAVIQQQKTTINPFKTATINVANPAVVSWTGHGLPVNTPVSFTTTGALPVGLATATTYYVKTVVSANSFTVSSTPGGDAIATTVAGSGTHTVWATNVTSPHQGKLLAAGYRATSGTNYDVALARYNTNGSLDTSFNTTGKYNTGVSSSFYDVLNDVIELDSGHILGAGYFNSSLTLATSSDFGLIRFQPSGIKDNSFNVTGTKAINISQLVYGTTKRDQAQSLIQDSNNKIVLVGSVVNSAAPESDEIAIARVLIDGTLDTTFGGDGIVTTDMSVNSDVGYEIKQDANGRYVVAGTSNENFAVARYNNDGTLDTTFAAGAGFISVPIGTNVDNAYSLDIQPDGKIVVGGYTSVDSLNRPAAIRLLDDGSLDTTFGTGGKMNLPFSRTTVARGMVIQNDGRYVLAGSTTGTTDVFVARLTVEDGDADGFGDAYDNCPINANADQADFDADSLGDACDPDADGDTVTDAGDNCLLLANPDQLNTDGDGDGNACDSDDDNDGVADGSDAFPLDASESVDTDSDGVGNNADGDDDGDGAADTVDTDPLNNAVNTEIDLPLDNSYDGSTIKDNQSVQ